VYQVGHCLRLY